MNFEEKAEYRVKQVIVPLGYIPDLVFMVPGTGFACVGTDIPDGAQLASSVFDQQAGVMRYFIYHDSFEVIDPKDLHAIPILRGATMRAASARPPKPKAEDKPRIVTE